MAGCTTPLIPCRRRKTLRRGRGGSRTGPISPAHPPRIARSAQPSPKAAGPRRPAIIRPGPRVADRLRETGIEQADRGRALKAGPERPSRCRILRVNRRGFLPLSTTSPDDPLASRRLLHRCTARGRRHARRGSRGGAVLQPIRGSVRASAKATVERARPPTHACAAAAGLSILSGRALPRPALSAAAVSRSALSGAGPRKSTRGCAVATIAAARRRRGGRRSFAYARRTPTPRPPPPPPAPPPRPPAAAPPPRGGSQRRAPQR